MIFWGLILSAALASPIEEGEYLVRAASCRECHTAQGGRAFAGGAPLLTNFGTFYTPNITPDRETGIGNWTEEDFHRALREGISPTGARYFPSFPYRSFTKMTDEDIAKIWAYLQAQTPVNKFNRPHDLWEPVDHRWLNRFWQFFYLERQTDDIRRNIEIAIGPFTPDPSRSASWNRGAYLTEAVLHCAECHTPRDLLGGMRVDEWMAGSDLKFSGKTPPNITPDLLSGIIWTREQWYEFLSSGIDPSGHSPGVEMALAVRAASSLTQADREAVVDYLMSLKPVKRYSRGGG